jgi:hypothetical protein
MEFVNTEPDADSERFLTSPPRGSQPVNIKAEKDPMLMTFPVMRSESEVSCVFVVKHISQNNNNLLSQAFPSVIDINIFLVD